VSLNIKNPEATGIPTDILLETAVMATPAFFEDAANKKKVIKNIIAANKAYQNHCLSIIDK
jgi:hypothetical protein